MASSYKLRKRNYFDRCDYKIPMYIFITTIFLSPRSILRNPELFDINGELQVSPDQYVTVEDDLSLSIKIARRSLVIYGNEGTFNFGVSESNEVQQMVLAFEALGCTVLHEVHSLRMKVMPPAPAA